MFCYVSETWTKKVGKIIKNITEHNMFVQSIVMFCYVFETWTKKVGKIIKNITCLFSPLLCFVMFLRLGQKKLGK